MYEYFVNEMSNKGKKKKKPRPTYKTNHVHAVLGQVHLCEGTRAVEGIEARPTAGGRDDGTDLRDAVENGLARANVVGSPYPEEGHGDGIGAGGPTMPIVDACSVGVGLPGAEDHGHTPSTALHKASLVVGAGDCVCVCVCV